MKFGNLLKKELRELINKQTIISMVFSMVLLIVMGQFMGNAMEEGLDTSEITVCDQDGSDFTKDVLAKVTEDGSASINYVDIRSEDYAAELKRLDIKNVIIIPEGFGKNITEDNRPSPVKFVNALPGGGLASSISSAAASDMIKSIQNACTDEILLKNHGLTDEQIKMAKSPVQTVEYTTNNGKTAQVSASVLGAITMTQSLIAPFVIFFLLMMASQMIMTAISTEKIDKTLETLLSAPVSRLTVLTAKMTAAVISALMSAAFMGVGFVFYVTGMTGSAMEEMTSAANSMTVTPDMSGFSESVTNLGQAMTELGMSLTPVSYILFALQLFFTIAIGLSISLILGATATDVKSVQTLQLPIMIAVMIPFFITMFADVNTMNPVLRIIMYLIPFTHTYTALGNLMNGNMLVFWLGMLYQIIFFAVCMYLAVKMFTTDKLFTVSFTADSGKGGFSFGKKKAAETTDES